jgi:cell division protein FtsL
MTATVAPARRRAPEAPALRLVEAPTERAARRSTDQLTFAAKAACATVAAFLVLLFVLAVLQTAIAQGQAHLDDLSAQTTDRQAEAQELRLTVAQLESPERIIGEAESRLGMVEPETVTYLAPVDATQPIVPNPVAPPVVPEAETTTDPATDPAAAP